MNKTLLLIVLLLSISVAFAVTHKVSPVVNPYERAPLINGEETIAVDAIGDPFLPPPPMVDTIGNVFRAGRTWYEGQHNGTIGRMLEIDTATGQVHMVYMRGIDSGATNRHIFYNVFNPATNSFLFGQFGQRVPPATISRSGFTSMGFYAPSAIPFAAFHEINPRATGATSNVYFDIESGIGAFVADAPMSLAYSGGTQITAIWPRISVGRNGVVHVVTTQST
ncbi:MAG: hypothetical protein N2450_00970, partial [bacterium]|nr:hypothetical protein [bacterium]